MDIFRAREPSANFSEKKTICRREISFIRTRIGWRIMYIIIGETVATLFVACPHTLYFVISCVHDNYARVNYSEPWAIFYEEINRLPLRFH